MTIGRGAIVAGGAVIVTAWVIASGPGLDRAPEAQRNTAGASAVSARPSHEERLRDRLAAMPAADDSHRDPFRFAAAPPRTEPPRAAVAAEAGAEPALQTPPLVPDLQLLGIAEDTHEGQPSRTAIISAMDGLFLVHEGEPIALRYQVRRIGADAVELEDLAAGTTIRLALP